MLFRSGDVAGNGKDAVRARSLGVNHAFGNALAVEMRHLLEELVILDQDRPAGARRQRVFWLSPTGRPAAVVRVFFSSIASILFRPPAQRALVGWLKRSTAERCGRPLSAPNPDSPIGASLHHLNSARMSPHFGLAFFGSKSQNGLAFCFVYNHVRVS